MDHQVIIVGGGIAGLTAALNLQKQGIDYLLLEANAEVGGRVKTRSVDGFLFDRGFQVLLTAYPEANRILDYDALNLSTFDPGALLLLDSGKTSVFGDPLRDLTTLWSTLASKGASFSDKIGVYRLSSRLKNTSIDSIFGKSESTTLQYLKNLGFTNTIIEAFFRPFFSGIFLENELSTSSRMFEFVFKMFSEGSAALPQNGMQEIPKQLLSKLDDAKVHTDEHVLSIDGNALQTNKGAYTTENIVLATDAKALSGLLDLPKPKYASTVHAHFSTTVTPYEKPLIALQSNSKGIVNNLCVVNKVSRAYAQKDNLLSVTLRSQLPLEKVEATVQKEMKNWFNDAENWKLVDLQTIEYALPNQNTVSENSPFQRKENIWICGDHKMHGSLQAAMKSGRLVAEAIAKGMKS